MQLMRSNHRSMSLQQRSGDLRQSNKRVMLVLRRMATYVSFSASTVADELPVMMPGLAGTATLGISLEDWRAIIHIMMDPRPAKSTETSLHLAMGTTGVSVFRVLIAETLSARGTQCKYPSMFSRPRGGGKPCCERT